MVYPAWMIGRMTGESLLGWCIVYFGGWFFMYPGFSSVVDFGVVSVSVFGGVWEVGGFV